MESESHIMFEIHSICLQHYQVVVVIIVLDKTWKQIHKTAKDNNNEGENDWLQRQKKKPMRFNSPTVVSVIVLDFPKFNVMDVMSVCLSVCLVYKMSVFTAISMAEHWQTCLVVLLLHLLLGFGPGLCSASMDYKCNSVLFCYYYYYYCLMQYWILSVFLSPSCRNAFFGNLRYFYTVCLLLCFIDKCIFMTPSLGSSPTRTIRTLCLPNSRNAQCLVPDTGSEE